MLVKPAKGKAAQPPFPGAIFQHDGGQSMTNYLSEARGAGKNPEINTMKLEAAGDVQAEVVITERRVLDWLLQQPGIDPKRIA